MEKELFLKKIDENIGDPLPLAVYADYLEEKGDEDQFYYRLAYFLRSQKRIHKYQPGDIVYTNKFMKDRITHIKLALFQDFLKEHAFYLEFYTSKYEFYLEEFLFGKELPKVGPILKLNTMVYTSRNSHDNFMPTKFLGTFEESPYPKQGMFWQEYEGIRFRNQNAEHQNSPLPTENVRFRYNGWVNNVVEI